MPYVPDPAAFTTQLQTFVERTANALFALSDQDVTLRASADAWSPKEVLGHLVDSASNNQERFVQALEQDHLVFDGYDQDASVEAHRYREADWTSLVTLWWMYNTHLIRTMATVPAEVRFEPRTEHNFHEIAWQPVPEDEPTTLDYLMRDYADHLRHHLAQILPELAVGVPSPAQDA